jgi:zinc transport system substrate-binding protein
MAGGNRESAPTSGDSEKPIVYSSILPVQFLADRIGGDRITSEVVVLPGESPATYEPTPKQMSALAQASLLFRVGVPFENGFLPKVRELSPDLTIIDLREGLTLRTMEAGHSHEHEGEDHEEAEEEEGHHHEAGSPDPHIWMSPRNMMIMAQTIADSLAEADPDGAELYKDNLAGLESDLKALDKRLGQALEPLSGKKFFVYHPAFGYFADDYGLVQIPLEIEGKEPTPKQLSYYIGEAKELGVEIIFVQPEFPKQSAQTVAKEIGGTVVPISALTKDYIANLDGLASALEEGLR